VGRQTPSWRHDDEQRPTRAPSFADNECDGRIRVSRRREHARASDVNVAFIFAAEA
jgi:hypothetical protein